MKPERRRFNKSERIALYLAADGKSELSGEPLGDDWHADHIIPWSKGGITDVINAQALNAKENLKKGASMPRTPRSWHHDFFSVYDNHISPNFLLAALPAAGKTYASLYLINDFLKEKPNRRVIIVTPTRNIREQWKNDAFRDFGIDLQTDEFSGYIPQLKPGFAGAVITYSLINRHPLVFRKFCQQFDVFFVFDEIHHAAEHNSYGDSIKQAAEKGVRRLLLTGTPFRTDRAKMPFVNLDDDGEVIMDYRYDYPQALRDGVIRELIFKRSGGHGKYKHGDTVYEHKTREELNEDQWRKLLLAFLRWDDFMISIYRAADRRLSEIRQDIPNAGGLIVCEDISEAKRQRDLLKQATGQYATLVASDDRDAQIKLEAFKASDARWVVAIQMISEGVDIPRLMVLVYATNITTDLCFRQIVGRVMRNQGTDEDSEAWVYAPDVEPLRTYMQEIERFQEQVIQERMPKPPKNGNDPPRESKYFESLGAENDYTETTTRGWHLNTKTSEMCQFLANKLKRPETEIIAAMQEYEMHFPPGEEQSHKDPQPQKPRENRLKSLRKKCFGILKQVAYKRYGYPIPEPAYPDIISEFRGWRRYKDKTEDELEAFKEWLMSQLN